MAGRAGVGATRPAAWWRPETGGRRRAQAAPGLRRPTSGHPGPPAAWDPARRSGRVVRSGPLHRLRSDPPRTQSIPRLLATPTGTRVEGTRQIDRLNALTRSVCSSAGAVVPWLGAGRHRPLGDDCTHRAVHDQHRPQDAKYRALRALLCPSCGSSAFAHAHVAGRVTGTPPTRATARRTEPCAAGTRNGERGRMAGVASPPDCMRMRRTIPWRAASSSRPPPLPRSLRGNRPARTPRQG